MTDVLLPGIAATTVATRRLTQSVLHPEGVDPAGPGEAVLFVHGNVSSSLFWQQTLLDDRGHGPAPRRSPSTCAGTATPSRCRSTRPAACATGPTTSPRWSTRSG